MTIDYQVLGAPGRDNAVYVSVDSGQSITRFLFDCGYGCIDSLSISDVQSLDGLFISHFHMDHVSGFDAVFRLNYDRQASPFLIAGPQDTHRAISNRLRGYTWNLVSDAKGAVEIREYSNGALHRTLYPTVQHFETATIDETKDSDGIVFESPEVSIQMIELNHGCVSAGYRVQTANRMNVDKNKISELNLQPGAWLQRIKNLDVDASEIVTVEDQSFTVGQLRENLMVETAGESFAYLTDFRAEGEDFERLVEFVHNVDVVVCENNYRDEELELAIKNHHLTSKEVGAIAAAAKVGKLILFHLSDRYQLDDWQSQIQQVRDVFPETHWPTHWSRLG